MARALEVGSAVAFGDLPYGLRPSAHSQEGCCQEGPCEEGRGEEARGEEVLLQEGLREEGSGQEARREEARQEGGEEVKSIKRLTAKGARFIPAPFDFHSCAENETEGRVVSLGRQD